MDALYILDVRAAADFEAGHIAGAVNTTLTELLADAALATDPIAVVCYTGQTAAFATMALRMSGYDDAFSMKFGMAAWHDDFSGPWDGNISNDRVFADDAAPALPEFGWPAVTETGSPEDILADRVDAVLASGYQGISNGTLYGDLTGYNIVNYWSAADYEHYGHIDGAYQLTPGNLTAATDLDALDPDGPNAIY
jgi:rhodanese-related sulfurtransferase